MKALDETQIWAETNASGFVGLKHFIQNVLTERKGFSFEPSSALVNILVDKGEIELFEVPSLDKSHNFEGDSSKAWLASIVIAPNLSKPFS